MVHRLMSMPSTDVLLFGVNRENQFSQFAPIRRSSRWRGTSCSYYPYKDVLEIGGVRHSSKLRNLVQLLAFQIGREVSLTELGSQLQMSKETVASYMDRLE